MVAMPRKIRTIFTAAAVLVGIAGCASSGNTGTNDDNGGFQYSNHDMSFAKPGHRQAALAVSGTTLQGTPFNLASLRGKYVVINFWSDGCGPCHGEEQGFEAASKEFASKGVAFLGIDERDNITNGRSFEQQYGVTYPSLFDSSDKFILDFPGAVPSTTPFTIVLDPQGRIAAKATDSLDLTTLRSLITTVQSEST
jgi:peroxiredoxin